MSDPFFGGYGARRRGFDQLFDAMDRAMGEIAQASPFGGYLMGPARRGSTQQQLQPGQTQQQAQTQGGGAPGTSGGAPGTIGIGGTQQAAPGSGGLETDTSMVPSEGFDLLTAPLSQGMQQLRLIPIDVLEDNDKFTVVADAHWVPKENIKIDVEGDNLVIHYETKKESKVEKANYVRNERSFAMSERTLRLPPNVDKSKFNAKYENGVLKVELPKTAPSAPKKSSVPVV